MPVITKSNWADTMRKFFWFGAYWLAGVATVGLVAEAIRLVFLPAKVH